MNDDETTIETGTDRGTDIPTTADVFSYVDDGEHATVWAMTRTGEQTADVLTFRCEAGLIDQDGPITEHHIGRVGLTEYAREYAREHQASGIENAREHWK